MRRPTRTDVALTLVSACVEAFVAFKFAQRRGWTYKFSRRLTS